MTKDPAPRRTLADIIMEKITEKQTELETRFSDAGSTHLQDIDPRVKQMYEGVRDVLRKYRSGKLPKAFKIIPNLRNWEQILYITGIIIIMCIIQIFYRSASLFSFNYCTLKKSFQILQLGLPHQCTRRQEYSLQTSKKRWPRGSIILYYCREFAMTWLNISASTSTCTKHYGRPYSNQAVS